MKMDLQGGEIDALLGASESIRTGLLRALPFEFGISNVNARVFFRDIFVLLSQNGYQIFRMTPAGNLIRIPCYSVGGSGDLCQNSNVFRTEITSQSTVRQLAMMRTCTVHDSQLPGISPVAAALVWHLSEFRIAAGGSNRCARFANANS